VTTAAGAWATAIGGGAAAGAVQSGNLKGAVQGALSAAVFFAIGGSGWSDPAQWGARAVTSGVLEEINGGNFGHGFLRAGLTEAIGGRIDTGNFVGDGIAHAILGGTMSAATGGKFANGAVTAAMSYAMGEVANRAEGKSQKDPGRALTAEEITFSHAAQMAAFGEDRIDYDQARVVKGKFVFFQGWNYAVTPNGRIYYPGDCGNFARCGDNAAEVRAHQFLFVHEMVHVLQHQQGVNVLWRALPLQIGKFLTFGLYDPYSVPMGVPYHRLNVEQQADFVAGHVYPEYVRYRR
jgi:hypothetical protein